MKIKLLVLSLILFVSIQINAQIAAWDFFGNNTATTTFAATTFSANLVTASSASNITRGTTAAATGANNSFRTIGFKNDGIATSNTDYFQTTLTAVSGYKLSLSTIDAKFGGTSTYYATPGVTSQFAYSLNGTTFTLIGSPVTTTSLTMTQIDLTGITGLQNVAAGTTITLRYYASGQTSTGGWGFLSGTTAGTNGLAIGGTFVSIPPVLTAASSNNDVDHNFNITFTENADWRHKITAVKVNGTNLSAADFDTTVSATLTLKPTAGNSLLTTSGSKTVIITATGYYADTVTQQINAGAVSATTSTASISSALALNSSRTVTATAKDQYSNLVSGYVFKVLPTITNASGTTTESYTVNGSSYTSTPAAQSLTATNGSGVATFAIVVPATVDGGDGVSVRVKLNNGTTNVGSFFAYSAPFPPALAISNAGLTEVNLNGAQVSLALSNETFTDGTLSSGNFTLNNAPSGTTVGSVTYNTTTTATVTLNFTGTNFNTDVTNFSITVAGSELTHASPVTSNALTITAVIETAPTVTSGTLGTPTTATDSITGGNVTSDGGGTYTAAVTARGVVWSTSTAPTVALSTKTADGTGTGSFSSYISGLTQGTVYYVRAYATNNVGTSYGAESSFTTLSTLPTIQSSGISFSAVTGTSITLNWTSGNGSNRVVLMYSGGVVSSDPVAGTSYSANADYGSGSRIGLKTYVVYNGSGNGVTVTGLAPNSTYHFFIYEFNGTAGSENYVTTSPLTGTQTCGVTPILITHYSPRYSTSEDEFIVLFNNSASSFDLNGYEIIYGGAGTSGGAQVSPGVKIFFTTSTVIPSNKYYLLATSAAVTVGSV